MKKKGDLAKLRHAKDKSNVKNQLIKKKKNNPISFTPLKLETYAIAYLDFLGTTERMNGDKSTESLNILNAVYTMLRLFCSTFEHHNMNIGDFDLRIFSDNVVIAKKIQDVNKSYVEDFADLLFATSIFQELSLSLFQWPLRGGIVVGELHINENLIWGQALVDAHNLEDKYAKYPRVVIDSKIIHQLSAISGIDSINQKIIDGLPASPILCDDDGQYYLSYLEPKFVILNTYHHLYDMRPELRSRDEASMIYIMNLITKQLTTGKENLTDLLKSAETADLKIQQKISWSVKYHNMMCDKHHHPEYKVT